MQLAHVASVGHFHSNYAVLARQKAQNTEKYNGGSSYHPTLSAVPTMCQYRIKFCLCFMMCSEFERLLLFLEIPCLWCCTILDWGSSIVLRKVKLFWHNLYESANHGKKL